MSSKKKVGVVTMYYRNSNYGACLQAYALPYVINKMGYDCEQISFTFRNDDNSSLSQKIKDSIKNYGIKNTLNIIFEVINKKKEQKKNSLNGSAQLISTRDEAVARFRENRIPHSEKTYSNQSIDQCNGYDAYVCGSDQIWRIGWGFLNPGFWLSFVNDGGKKISYAASISMNEIPEKEHILVKNALADYDFISVRELQGKEILDSILEGEKDVNWVVDPTLLLTKEEWEEITAENPYKDEKYIFAYLLGDKQEDRDEIMAYAERNGMKVIAIPYLLGEYRACDENFGHIKLSDVSPELFVSLIRDAKEVITDSFHGSVFSLIFNTPFRSLKRSSDESKDSMNSRIYSLLRLCECSDRVIDAKELSALSPSQDSMNFEKINNVLKGERERCIDLLKGALGEEK